MQKTLIAATGLTLLVTACGTRERPIAGPEIAPAGLIVTITRPSTDTVVTRGSIVSIRAEASSSERLVFFKAVVVGQFEFPVINPDTTEFFRAFSIATAGWVGDTVLVSVSVADVTGETGIAQRFITLIEPQ